MASAKSMTDIAYDVISKKKRAVQFVKLWEEVSKLYGASNDKVAQFYSDLTFFFCNTMPIFCTPTSTKTDKQICS